MKIFIPAQLKSDISGYSYFANIHRKYFDCENESIDFDFSECSWFEANLAAVLGGILSELQGKGNKVRLINIGPEQHNILTRNRFLASFGYDSTPDLIGTTAHYEKFDITDERKIKDYIEAELLNKPDMPQISQALKTEIIRSIFEIYSNAIMHGKCNFVFSCGQYYPRKSPPHMYFTIVDLGETIKSNVASFLKQPYSGEEAILWALKEGNTTKIGSQPGGLGFAVIQEFVKMNNGRIQIASADGYWEYVKGKIFSTTMSQDFAGTIVNLVFNLADTNAYSLKSEQRDIHF